MCDLWCLSPNLSKIVLPVVLQRIEEPESRVTMSRLFE